MYIKSYDKDKKIKRNSFKPDYVYTYILWCIKSKET